MICFVLCKTVNLLTDPYLHWLTEMEVACLDAKHLWEFTYLWNVGGGRRWEWIFCVKDLQVSDLKNLMFLLSCMSQFFLSLVYLICIIWPLERRKEDCWGKPVGSSIHSEIYPWSFVVFFSYSVPRHDFTKHVLHGNIS